MSFIGAYWANRANEEVTRYVETHDCRTPEEIEMSRRVRRAEVVSEVAGHISEYVRPAESVVNA